MSRRKTERLLNLVICLLATRRPLSAEQIRQAVPGYDRDGDEAFQRMFERDKNELREIGIPIDVVRDPWEDEPGYRIERESYELPEITLEPDEAAVLGLAAQVWQRASLAEAASGALLKLRAGGVATDQPVGTGALELRVDTRDPAFPALWDAVRDRRVVRFDYRSAGSETVRSRTVEPWGVVSRRGRWYLAGYDRDRDAPRAFRLSRITGQVSTVGRPGAVEVPEGVDLRAMVGFPDETTDERVAVVRVRQGACEGLRQLARAVRPGTGGWDEAELAFTDPERLAGWMASLGADVEVVEPPDAREAVIRRLKGALA
ncbi:FIG005453: Putative DeoR-family transcriptional regulator [[Actinomadura] parvosata subsp. kistnae]|uniref:DNA-binding transcriptional regulator n=1 Tax=[Actinomadura] parvosata subsp. kistnae TaxID=1909395 RepID=A0A1V0AIY4_9ACTN|nr:WYL domain-containing protein [Nonomuraea sp. ATCC 55076]AQZ70181.1 DNA-binding transcriptional regulator [Nonomuraea sp. ATCC 55076]SPL97811.1 FIG005453: Putative DeoR-family transcriptional regulator [Actinomadura parvosata subsp. kistnae]